MDKLKKVFERGLFTLSTLYFSAINYILINNYIENYKKIAEDDMIFEKSLIGITTSASLFLLYKSYRSFTKKPKKSRLENKLESI